MPLFEDHQSGFTDDIFVAWIQSGDKDLCKQACCRLWEHPKFVKILRKRCRQKLERRHMLFPDQAAYVPDAEDELCSWVFVRGMSAATLPRTLMRGEGFDPQRGSILNWLLTAADNDVRDWFKKHASPSVSEKPLQQDSGEAFVASELRPSETERLASLAVIRIAIANLPLMRRACMIAKYLGTNALPLSDEELTCLWRVRSGKKSSKLTPSDGELATARADLSALWDEVTCSGREEGNSSSKQRDYENRVCALAIHLKIEDTKAADFRRRLLAEGLTDGQLEALATAACQMTFANILESYGNRWTSERGFMEFTRRSYLTARKLRAARDRLQRSLGLNLPSPAKIAKFLNSTPNAVSTALTHAHRQLEEITSEQTVARTREM